MHESIIEGLKRIREEKPLILNITNHVTMDFVANGLLCVGASPIMSQSIIEAEDLVRAAQAVVINIGTLNDDFIQLAEAICFLANTFKKPLILDPVGAGASAYRTKIVQGWIERFHFSMIRGNASECVALIKGDKSAHGVDSLVNTMDIVPIVKTYALTTSTVMMVSGQTDFIVQKHKVCFVKEGHPLMPRVTGSGCLLTSVLAAFASVSEDHFQAAVNAVTYYGLCGAIAAKKSIGPASFKVQFLDALANFALEMQHEKV